MKKSFLYSFALIVATSFITSCSTTKKEKYYEKNVSFSGALSLDEKIDKASRLVPTPQQLDWQRMELTAFLHFGINTFTGKEWGTGQEDPAIFNPTDLDAEQWVRVLKENGFKMVLITAKHHDGFCLWPTKTTTHSVESSPWRNGKGDLVKELKDACDKHGLRFGVYLSPWDRNASSYGTPEYNHFFVEQLTELLTNYGDIYEVWFDGANGEGPNGKKQQYDWELILSTIRKLQPKAVTAIMGDDVRWVGNEEGLGRETEWSATVLTPGSYTRSGSQDKTLGINALSKDLGSRKMIEKASELFWYPSEVDVSIRPGWFYHEEEDNKVKSLQQLVDIYFKSVGYNSLLLLNIPPDKAGRINRHDEARLSEFSAYLKNVFKDNKVTNRQQTKSLNETKSIEYILKDNSPINVILIEEDIEKGQRIEEFSVEALVGDSWEKIADGTTVGYKRMLRVPAFSASKIRLTVNKSRNEANIANIGAFYAEPLTELSDIRVLNEVPSNGWKILQPINVSANLFEGKEIQQWKSSNFLPLIVNLNAPTEISGFSYTPVKGENKSGTIFRYNFYTSNDGLSWQKILSDQEFSNIENNPISQFVNFKEKHKTSYIKFEPIRTTDNTAFYSVGKFGLLVK